jgi:capsid portal protein
MSVAFDLAATVTVEYLIGDRKIKGNKYMYRGMNAERKITHVKQ